MSVSPPDIIEYAMCLPSAAQEGSSFCPPPVVSLITSFVSTLTVQIWNTPSMRDTYAIRSPFGDQSGDVL